MDTDEHTPIERPRTRAQERHNTYVRLAKVVVGPVMAALVSIAVAYIQRSSDKAEGDNKAKAVEQKVEVAKAAVDKAIAGVKADVAVVSNAAQPVAQLVVETHEDVTGRADKRRRADPKLVSQVKKSITDLKKVEAKAKLPPAPPPQAVPPVTWPSTNGGGGATTNPSRGARE